MSKVLFIVPRWLHRFPDCRWAAARAVPFIAAMIIAGGAALSSHEGAAAAGNTETSPSDAAQVTGFLDRAVTLGGATHHFSVYVPPSYTPARSWPVLVDLHGNGAQGSDGIRQTAHFLGDRIRLERSKYPIVVVFPQAAAGATWTSPAMQSLVVAELDEVLAAFHGDARRVYLGGFSMGAAGTYAIAARWPDRFAAAYAIAGVAPMPVDDLAARIRRIPIRIFHGATDERVPVEESRRLVAALHKAGGAVEYTEYVDTHHGPAAEKAYAAADFITWLLSHERPR